jgi:hypothetical protein
MPIVDLSDQEQFQRRNLWQPDAVTITVRPGLRRVHAPTDNYTFCGGHSIKSPTSGEIHHYVLESIERGVPQLFIRRYDEYWNEIESLLLDGITRPQAVTFVPVGQEMLICGRGMPTVRVLLGGHMQMAQRVESTNVLNTTALPFVPSGIGVSWKNRAVIAASPLQDASAGLIFSDPGAPQTFVGQNFLPGPWASPVHALHVTAQGALAVATETGIWGVPDGVVGAGQIIAQEQIGEIAKVPVYDYNQVCAVRETLWVLTRRGIRQVWPTQGEELLLNEMSMPRTKKGAARSGDYRAGGRIIGTQLGPMVAYEGELYLFDVTTGHRGWWDCSENNFDLVAVLHDFDGDELLMTEGGVYRLEGNFDGELDASSEFGTAVAGYFSGRLPAGPDDEMAINIVAGKTTGHGTPFASINGRVTESAVLPQEGGVEGLSSWSSTTTFFEEQGLTLMRHNIDKDAAWRAGEAALEYGTTGPNSRVWPLVDVNLGGSKRTRGRIAKGGA